MICFKTDLYKGGITLGVIVGIMSIIGMLANSIQALCVVIILAFVILLSFPIVMGTKRKKSLPRETSFGFCKAYRYSYTMLFVAYFIAILLFVILVPIIGKYALPELVVNLIMELNMPLPQEAIDVISDLYTGYAWLPYAAIKLFVAPAILAIIPALCIKKKKRKFQS